MLLSIPIGQLDVFVTARPLSREAFAAFGDVIQNPQPKITPSSAAVILPSQLLPYDGVTANQGSAIKYQHVSRPVNLYDQAPSRVPGKGIMSLFVCGARKLEQDAQLSAGQGDRRRRRGDCFVVEILERHPFTTQTFIPLTADQAASFLVIVAPSLPPSRADEALPVPKAGVGTSLPGRGLPDLRRLQAFTATAGQAVTYGAGTWHAPMVALGAPGTAIDFVVIQSANGVGIEDCQEVVFQSDGVGRPRVVVLVPQVRLSKL
jgi:ureidoglycolate lyase